MPESVDVRGARRLALARAGLLRPERTGLPTRGAGRGRRARRAAHAVVERFGYLQLDTVSVSGARTQGLVLLSRLDGFDPALAEELLRPGEPLFEYWGHEASWVPLDLYPVMAFRRAAYRRHPWWGDVVGRHPKVAERVLARLRDEGPLRSKDFESGGRRGTWWDTGHARQVAAALWSSGDLAVRERVAFHRVWDLAERVIPEAVRGRDLPREEAFRVLLLRAAAGHGWAERRTLAGTFRLRGKAVDRALAELEEEGALRRCDLVAEDGSRRAGWIRPGDLAAVDGLRRARPRGDRGVLLSPFDPVLWDRDRCEHLFDFHQRIEIYTPKAKRRFGYYCLPVLAGDRLVGRVDLKADRRAGVLRVLARHHEAGARPPARDRTAVATALDRHAGLLGLRLVDG